MAEQDRETRFKGCDVIVAGLIAGLVTVALLPLDIRASHSADAVIHWSGFWLICGAIAAVLAVRDFTRKQNALSAAALDALLETTLIVIFAVLPLVTLS